MMKSSGSSAEAAVMSQGDGTSRSRAARRDLGLTTILPETSWSRALAPYARPVLRRSLFQLLNSAIPFFLLWLLMLRSLEHAYGITLLLAVPAAGFLIRLFIIQHDCGHGSFFRSRAANDTLGFILGVLTLTPYGYWRRTHAI